MNLENLLEKLSETEFLASGVTLSFRVVQLSRANKPVVISLLIKLYWKQPFLNPWQRLFYGRKTQVLLKIYIKRRKCIAKKRLYNLRK